MDRLLGFSRREREREWRQLNEELNRIAQDADGAEQPDIMVECQLQPPHRRRRSGGNDHANGSDAYPPRSASERPPTTRTPVTGGSSIAADTPPMNSTVAEVSSTPRNLKDVADSLVNPEKPPVRPSYQYQRLQPGHTRLLRLLPASRLRYGHLEANYELELKGSIQHVPLDSAMGRPPFTALSYVCGPEDDSRTINLDGSILKISARLHNILTNIRLLQDPRNLWIDAICINQTDMDERMEQVKSMGNIYAHATYVLAWLEVDNHDVESRRKIDSCATVLERLPGGRYPSEHEWGFKVMLAQILNNPYWTRRWIAQEILQANNITVQFEGSVLHEYSFAQLGHVLESDKFSSKLGEYDSRTMRNSPVLRLWNQKKVRRRGGGPLASLIRNMDGTCCQLKHDKVFALLSLAGPERDLYKFDYETPLIDLLIEVVEISCSQPEFISGGVLGFATYLRSELGIPRKDILEKIALEKSQAQQGLRISCPIHVRGVATGDLTVDQQQRLVAMRGRCRPLYQYTSLYMHLGENDAFCATYDHQRMQQLCKILWHVSRTDLPSFVRTATKNTPESEICFASCDIEPGDEIWQFEDTDLALIVRNMPDLGVQIIGRAQQFHRNDRSADRNSHRNWEDSKALKPSTDQSLEPSLKFKSIMLDRIMLLTLILWTSFVKDDESQ